MRFVSIALALLVSFTVATDQLRLGDYCVQHADCASAFCSGVCREAPAEVDRSSVISKKIITFAKAHAYAEIQKRLKAAIVSDMKAKLGLLALAADAEVATDATTDTTIPSTDTTVPTDQVTPPAEEVTPPAEETKPDL